MIHDNYEWPGLTATRARAVALSGDPLRQASTARAADVPAATAEWLTESLRKAEATISEHHRQ